jgi:hypothetical protein
MKEVEPMCPLARLSHENTLLEVRRKIQLLLDQEAETINVLIEDDNKYAPGDNPYYNESPGRTAPPIADLPLSTNGARKPTTRLQSGSLVTIMTGPQKGQVGIVDSMYSKEVKPNGQTCWNIKVITGKVKFPRWYPYSNNNLQILDNKPVIRRMEKTLKIAGAYD